MTPSAIAALPVESRFVPGCMESILDKKVAKTALNILERLIDWIASRIYCPYNNLYQAKLARIHRFSDTTPLLDSTKQGIATIDRDGGHDCINLHNNKVCFWPNPHTERVFSRSAYISYIVVQDDGRSGWYKITEHELARPGNERPMAKYWFINTNQFHQFQGLDRPPFYLAQT